MLNPKVIKFQHDFPREHIFRDIIAKTAAAQRALVSKPISQRGARCIDFLLYW